MLIRGIQKTSLIDFPGKIATTLFLDSCNFRCPYCYNIDLVLGTNKLENHTEEEILEFLKSRKKFIDGVCLTGGEPCLHPDLKEFIAKIKNLGLLVKLDTNGTNPEVLKELIEEKLIDYIAMDIKAPLEKYEKVVKRKVDLEKIQESVNIIRNSGIDYEFRTTVVPGLFNREDALAIGKWLKGSRRYFLQQFRSEKTLDEKFKGKEPYSIEQLKELAETAKPFFEKVEIRGI